MVAIKITGVTNAAITEKTTVRPFRSDRVSATSFAVTAAAETAIKSLLPHFLSRYSSDASGFISFHHSPPYETGSADRSLPLFPVSVQADKHVRLRPPETGFQTLPFRTLARLHWNNSQRGIPNECPGVIT